MTMSAIPPISVDYPFSLTAGQVSMTVDPSETMKSNVAFCLGTHIGERIMMPTWGVNIMNSLHALGAEIDEVLALAVEETFSRWFPEYEVKEIKLFKDPRYLTHVDVEIWYWLPGAALLSTSKFAVQVPDGSVSTR